jgi:hypothetical protein
MATTENVLANLSCVEPHLRALATAIRAQEIVGAVGGYLASWTPERIENLQKVDGGWGTFDNQQRPEAINGVADIVRISNVLARQCLALRDAGIEPTPELLELNLYFAFAKDAAETFLSSRRGAYARMPGSQARSRRADRSAAAA